ARSATGIIGLCYLHPDHVTDETIDCYFSPLISSPRRVALTNAYAVGLDPNPLAGIEPALRHSPIPTRIVWGMADEFFSADSPGYLDRVFARSQGVRRLPQAKTFFPEEFPDLIAQEAHRLWRS